MKVCSKCQVAKPESDFEIRTDLATAAPRGVCVKCRRAADAKRHREVRSAKEAEAVRRVVAISDDSLAAIATDTQHRIALWLRNNNSIQATAMEIDATVESVRSHVYKLLSACAQRGVSPVDGKASRVPPGYVVRGHSTLERVGADGSRETVLEWTKTKQDDAVKYQALEDAIVHLADGWESRAEPVTTPSVLDEDLMCVYPMGDPHFGMYAWGEESGSNFDLKIAEHNLCTATDQLVAGAPPAHDALIINLGDFFHADNVSSRTARSGHQLDVDSRWGRVMRVGIRAMRRCIDRALTKHRRVRVVCEIGNHDDHSSIMLALALEQYYECEPRVAIDTSPAKFHWVHYGDTLIGITHGDTVKLEQLGGIMACDQPEAWGATKYRYWYTGHVHSDRVRELPGVLVETFRTLAPKDAWASAAGYRAGQDMKVDVIHRHHGRIQRNTVGIRQIINH